MARYELIMRVQSDVVDDRLRKEVDATTRELQEQAAAYVEVTMRQHLVEKLTKIYGYSPVAAQLAQAAVDVFIEELRHIHLELPSIQAQLHETKNANAELPLLTEAEWDDLEDQESRHRNSLPPDFF